MDAVLPADLGGAPRANRQDTKARLSMRQSYGKYFRPIRRDGDFVVRVRYNVSLQAAEVFPVVLTELGVTLVADTKTRLTDVD